MNIGFIPNTPKSITLKMERKMMFLSETRFSAQESISFVSRVTLLRFLYYGLTGFPFGLIILIFLSLRMRVGM